MPASCWPRPATREFEDLAEPDDWAVAHQKLALAHRGAGDLNQANWGPRSSWPYEVGLTLKVGDMASSHQQG